MRKDERAEAVVRGGGRATNHFRGGPRRGRGFCLCGDPASRPDRAGAARGPRRPPDYSAAVFFGDRSE